MEWGEPSSGRRDEKRERVRDAVEKFQGENYILQAVHLQRPLRLK
jgi:hypothetical protein